MGKRADVYNKKNSIVKRALSEFEKNADGFPVMLWKTKKDGSSNYFNQQWSKYTGQAKIEALGFGWLNAVHSEDRASVSEIFFQANLKQKPFRVSFRLKTASGKFRWAVMTGNPQRNSSGLYMGYAGVISDINDFKKMKNERRSEIATGPRPVSTLSSTLVFNLPHHDRDKASQSKSAFLANISHEIRTPLGAILGFTELLNESISPNDRAEYAKIISRNGKALTKIIDDILDLSKVESGRLELEHVVFDIQALIAEVKDLFMDIVEKKQLTFSIEFDYNIPQKIYSDPTRIRQILINLIGNAVKFTAHGSIKVVVEPSLPKMELKQIKFRIEDTGVGMTKDQSRHLFEPFSQIDNSSTRKFGGSGLGLVLSRRLAKALGGDVWVDSSSLGNGSVFIAIVNATIPENELVESPVIEGYTNDFQTRALKILLVEDSVDNQMLVERVLSRAGMAVEIAKNGQEAVDLVRSNSYDIILMDMQMPILDGYEATTQLRKSGYRKPIIALTAHAMVEERRRTLSVGCDAHLTKPLDFEKLVKTISHFAIEPHSSH